MIDLDKRIISFLAQAQAPQSPAQIADALSVDEHEIRNTLMFLLNNTTVDEANIKGRYELVCGGNDERQG